MIGYIQRNIKRLSIVLWIIVAAFVGTIFLVWGRGSFLGMGGNYIAKVGSIEIPVRDFERAYYKVVDFYRRLYGNRINQEMLKRMGVKEQALNMLVNNAIILNAAQKEGLTVSPKEIAETLASIKAFQVNGRFDPQRYKMVLKANGLTPVEFERDLYNEILRKKLEAIVKGNAVVYPQEATLMAKRLLESASIKYFMADVSDFKNMVDVSRKEAMEYYKKHKEEFRTEPQLSLEYVVIKPDDFKKGVKITQKDIESYYRENPDQFMDKEGKIKPLKDVKEKIKRILLEEKARKEALRAALKLQREMEKSTMEKVCKEKGIPIKKVPLSPISSIKLPKDVVNAAMRAPEDKPTDVVKTDQGFYIAVVDRKIPSRIPSFSEVEEDVVARLREKKAPDTAGKWAKKLLKKGKDLESVVKKGGLKYEVKTASGITRVSANIEGQNFRKLASKVFEVKPGGTGYVVENGKLVVFEVKGITDPSPKELEKKASELKPMILANKREEVWRQFIREARERTEIKINQKIWGMIK